MYQSEEFAAFLADRGLLLLLLSLLLLLVVVLVSPRLFKKAEGIVLSPLSVCLSVR